LNNLENDVDKYLKNAKVSNVTVNSKEKQMIMDIALTEIIDEKAATALKDNVLSLFPFLNDVRFNFSYETRGQALSETIKTCKQGILSAVKIESPVCAEMMSGSEWRFDDNERVLDIIVSPNTSFLLMKKGIGRFIEKLIGLNLGESVRVEFKEDGAAIEPIVHAVRHVPTEAEYAVTKNKPAYSPKPAAKTWDSNNVKKGSGGGRRGVKVSSEIKGVLTKLSEEITDGDSIVIDGMIFNMDKRETKSGKLLFTLDISDGSGAITVKFFIEPDKFTEEFESLIKKGSTVRVSGRTQYDDYSKETNIMANEFAPGTYRKTARQDDYDGQKRVELHLHTKMSKMDATNTAEDYIKRAKEWGHTALAITDHGVVQAFPDAYSAAKKAGIKVLYGTEAYLVDDAETIVKMPADKTLNDEFVVFDVETTGLNKHSCRIIEIGAVKVVGGKTAETFSAFINPGSLLPAEIIKLTKITDDMLKDAPNEEVVLKEFLNFVGDLPVVAHNARFDTGFISAAAKRIGQRFGNTSLCTVEASRVLLPDLPNHKLNTVCKGLAVSLKNHHRAVEDAAATAQVFIKLCKKFKKAGVESLLDVNDYARDKVGVKNLKSYHAVVFAKNMTGLKNLYEIVSRAHLEHYAKTPRLPKSVFSRLKEGLIIGTACEAGEFYQAILGGASEEIIDNLADFYDYFEIQPLGNNEYMQRECIVNSKKQLEDINKKIVELGEKYNKPVVATCDVHFIDPEDEIYRRIIMAGEGYSDADLQAPLFYRTTEEMLKEFSYLGEKKAEEVVITNTNLIADMCEEMKPVPEEMCPPEIPGAKEELEQMTMKRAEELYGNPLPKIVAERIEREIVPIKDNGYAVMYMIAQKLVKNSMDNGYLVGSRGSVGSSFVATLVGITEVNPLQPHYYCSNCQYSDFDSPEVSEYLKAGASGCDMEDKDCPNCGQTLNKDGHNIPFEVFLGFDCEKVPDIDLNFSGEYQSKAHDYVKELFGEDYVFKAGTIGTLAEKTAYGYVKKYMDERGVPTRNAEINRLVAGIAGLKKTTGQHPGGMVVLPKGRSIYEFCPVQRPADKTESDTITTHFDFNSMHDTLLKLDMLGHDVPTIIRMLHDMTEIDPRDIDLGDKETLSLLTSPRALGVSSEEINCETGTFGLPELGTNFVRQMLMETQPSSFAELVGISGLSHGTDVWTNNAQDLVKEGTATLKQIVTTREDIMNYLISKGVAKQAAFTIMEKVRRGRGVSAEEAKMMADADIAEWYIESCRKIQYLFPKAHAVAYVTMAVRIGWFKIHHPQAFYAACFSVKAEDFDYEKMCKGINAAKNEIKRINSLGKEATAKDKNSVILLEIVIEMYARGLQFAQLDLYKSTADKFTITEDMKLLPPLCAVQGLGGSAAQSVVEAREDGEFISVENFRERTKINKTVIEMMKDNGIMAGISDTNQVSLFDQI